jgi:hypothetical protein
MLLAEGLRGRWPVESTWLETILSEKEDGRRNAAEDLMLSELKAIGPAGAAKLLPCLMDFLLVSQDDAMRLIFFYRSRIRTWVLEHVSYEDVTACLDEVQLESLWQAPHSLPAQLLLGMLENSDQVEHSRLPVRINAVRVLGAEHVDTLTQLLRSDSLGMVAAERFWKVSPETAERMLTANASNHVAAASQRMLVLSAPPERTGAVAHAILTTPAVLNAGEHADWAKQRLPDASAHAEALWAILGFGVGGDAALGHIQAC